MNVGLTAGQRRQLTPVLADRVDAENARRAREALERHDIWRPDPEADVSAPVEV